MNLWLRLHLQMLVHCLVSARSLYTGLESESLHGRLVASHEVCMGLQKVSGKWRSDVRDKFSDDVLEIGAFVLWVEFVRSQ